MPLYRLKGVAGGQGAATPTVSRVRLHGCQVTAFSTVNVRTYRYMLIFSLITELTRIIFMHENCHHIFSFYFGVLN